WRAEAGKSISAGLAYQISLLEKQLGIAGSAAPPSSAATPQKPSRWADLKRRAQEHHEQSRQERRDRRADIQRQADETAEGRPVYLSSGEEASGEERERQRLQWEQYEKWRKETEPK